MKKWIITNFPQLGRYKRYFVALWDHLRGTRETYSQAKEDLFIVNELDNYHIDGSIYVDVGANHPTDISNTYLMYRKGMKGVVIEPNAELLQLFKKFRKRDIAFPIGISNDAGIFKFNVSKTPVLSTFSKNAVADFYKSEYVPVMPLDAALNEIKDKLINLLSIDVEGLNVEVLQGASQTINRTLMICIEFDSEGDKRKIDGILLPNFDLVKTLGCNLIYINRYLKAELKKI